MAAGYRLYGNMPTPWRVLQVAQQKLHVLRIAKVGVAVAADISMVAWS